MIKVAVMLAPGSEEIEALTPVDVLRRLDITVTTVGLTGRSLLGAHQIPLTADTSLAELGRDLLTYTAVVFPGGTAGAEALRDSDELMTLMQARQAAGQWNAAMCAAPLAFARYGLLDGHDYTCFPGIEDQIKGTNPTARFHPDLTVVDPAGHLITSRGPATALAFAYCIATTLGVDPAAVKRAMLYPLLFTESN